MVFPWEIRGKHPRLLFLFPDASVPSTESFSTPPFPAGSTHIVPVLKLSHNEEDEGESSLCFLVLAPFFLCSMCVVRTAHAWCCLPGQDRQIMLDNDDLEYDSMDGEEEDYDEVPEMDSLEQPAVGGELPCIHLALRAKLLGETMELPQILLGWCLCIQLGSGSLCHLSGQDLGFPALSLVLWEGCTFSITVLPAPRRPCTLSPSLKPSPAVMGGVLGWQDLLPWQVSCVLVMSHRMDPKGPSRSGKPQWQQPLESPSITFSRGAVTIMSPCHRPSNSFLGSVLGDSLPRVVSPILNSSTWAEHRDVSSSQTLPVLSLPLLGFPLLCQVGLEASTTGVLLAPACPHQQRFPHS